MPDSKTDSNVDGKSDQWGKFDYDRVHVITRDIARHMIAIVNATGALAHPTTSILELGCGSGALTQELTDAFPAAAILATDLSDGMVEQTETLHLPRTKTRTLDAMDLAPVGELPITAVLSQATVQFCPDPIQPVREAYKLLQAARGRSEDNASADADGQQQQHPPGAYVLGLATWNEMDTERLFNEVGHELGLDRDVSAMFTKDCGWPADVAGVREVLETAGFRNVNVVQEYFSEAARESVEARLEHMWEWENPAVVKMRSLLFDAGFSREQCVAATRKLLEQGEKGEGRFGTALKDIRSGCILAMGHI